MELKHAVIREVMIQCETKLSTNCFLGESFIPMEIETVKDSLNQARKEGWCIRRGMSCCPSCKKYIELFGYGGLNKYGKESKRFE